MSGSDRDQADWEHSWIDAVLCRDWPRAQQLIIEGCFFLDEGVAAAINERFCRFVLPTLRREDVVTHESVSMLLVMTIGEEFTPEIHRLLAEYGEQNYARFCDPAARAWAENAIRDTTEPADAMRRLIEILRTSPEAARNEVLFGIAMVAENISIELGQQAVRIIAGGVRRNQHSSPKS